MEFDLAYGCGNAYLFDYGDRYLATKGSQWRNGEPTEFQRDLFQRLRDKVKNMSSGSISFAEPGAKKGEYGAAIAALNAEVALRNGRKIESETARQFIKENLHQRVAAEQSIAVTINGHGDVNVEVAVKRAIATFSNSEEADFLDYLKKILSENEMIVDGSCIKIRHVKFPFHITDKQLDAVRTRIRAEIRRYAPDAEVALVQFPIHQKVAETAGTLHGPKPPP